jgi:hydrogenase maturation protease
MVKIIGIGNPLRSDDGIGRYIVRRMRQFAGVEIIESAGEGCDVIELWNDQDYVILVDAVSSGNKPGTIHRFDARAGQIPSGLFRCSTHTFGAAEAIELARALGKMPEQLIVYGVECEKFDYGESISEELKEPMETILHRIAQEIQAASGVRGRMTSQQSVLPIITNGQERSTLP